MFNVLCFASGAAEWAAGGRGEAAEGAEAGRSDVRCGRARGQGGDRGRGCDTARRVGQLHRQPAEDQGALGGGHCQSTYLVLILNVLEWAEQIYYRFRTFLADLQQK